MHSALIVLYFSAFIDHMIFLRFFVDTPTSSLSLGGLHSTAGVKRLSGIMSALNSMETMQKSVMNAFALKYSMLQNSP